MNGAEVSINGLETMHRFFQLSRSTARNRHRRNGRVIEHNQRASFVVPGESAYVAKVYYKALVDPEKVCASVVGVCL